VDAGSIPAASIRLARRIRFAFGNDASGEGVPAVNYRPGSVPPPMTAGRAGTMIRA